MAKDMYCIGIDVGLKGAIAQFVKDKQGNSAWYVSLLPHKVVKIRNVIFASKKIDVQELTNLLEVPTCSVYAAAVENTFPRAWKGRRESKKALCTTCYNMGRITGVLDYVFSNSDQIIIAEPYLWKPSLGVTSDKQTSLDKVKELGIILPSKFETDDNVAEAVLLAIYAMKEVIGVKYNEKPIKAAILIN